MLYNRLFVHIFPCIERLHRFSYVLSLKQSARVQYRGRQPPRCLCGEYSCFDFLFLYVRPHKLLLDKPHSSAELLARPIIKGRASSNSFELCGVLARANYKKLTKICNAVLIHANHPWLGCSDL